MPQQTVVVRDGAVEAKEK